jgi:hypothetical protein
MGLTDSTLCRGGAEDETSDRFCVSVKLWCNYDLLNWVPFSLNLGMLEVEVWRQSETLLKVVPMTCTSV